MEPDYFIVIPNINSCMKLSKLLNFLSQNTQNEIRMMVITGLRPQTCCDVKMRSIYIKHISNILYKQSVMLFIFMRKPLQTATHSVLC